MERGAKRAVLACLSSLPKHRTELVLAAVAVAFYLPGIGWGLPYATDPERIRSGATDAITPLGPLAQLYDTLIATTPNRHVGYPLMHYFVVALVYTPYLACLLLTGALTRPGAEYPFGLADPVTSLQVLEFLGRAVSIGMAAGTVVVGHHTAKCLWGHTAGVLAAVFMMLSYPMFYYSRTGNLDVPVLFWTSLGLLVYAQILQRGLTIRRAIWLGVFAAFAVATKDQGWGAFALLPAVLLPLHVQRSLREGAPISWRPLIMGAAACVLAYAIASGFAIGPERYLAHIAYVRAPTLFSGMERFPATLPGYTGLLGQILGQLADATGPLMLLAAAVGVVIVSRKEPLKLAMLVPALGHVLLVLVPIRHSSFRYMMPMALLTAFFAARALAEGLRSARGLRIVSFCSTIAICGWLLVLGADLTYQMRNDSHSAAATWLDIQTEAGDEIGHVIPASYLPRLKPGIRYFLVPEGAAAAEQIVQRRPRFVVIMPDWTSPKGGQYPKRFPGEAYQGLVDGSLGYRLAARFKSDALVTRQILDYPTVNPPIEIYVKR